MAEFDPEMSTISPLMHPKQFSTNILVVLTLPINASSSREETPYVKILYEIQMQNKIQLLPDTLSVNTFTSWPISVIIFSQFFNQLFFIKKIMCCSSKRLKYPYGEFQADSYISSSYNVGSFQKISPPRPDCHSYYTSSDYNKSHQLTEYSSVLASRKQSYPRYLFPFVLYSLFSRQSPLMLFLHEQPLPSHE